MGRTYTAKQKARALEIYVAHGPCQAARDTGIPKPTIINWAKAAGLVPPTENITDGVKAQEARIAAKRAKLKERFLDEAAYCMDAIHNEHIDFKGKDVQQVVYPVAPAAAVQHYATALAIFIDKFRLESGEVTSRDEHRNVVRSDLDREIDTLMAEMARREEAGLTGPPAAEVGLVTVDTPLARAEAEAIS